MDFEGCIGNADIEALHVASPQGFSKALQKKRQSDGGHEQDDVILIDQRAQHQTFDSEGQRDHHYHGKNQREPYGHTLFDQTHQRHAANSTMAPWAKLNTPGRLEDENEAQRHQGIHDAGEQAGDDYLDEECGKFPHVDKWGDEDRA